MIKDDNMREIILKIVTRIKETYSPEKIILFGSYAYGLPEKESDIDLLIIKDTQDRVIDRMVQIYKIVDLRKIDLSPFVVTPEELRQRIELGDHFFKEIWVFVIYREKRLCISLSERVL